MDNKEQQKNTDIEEVTMSRANSLYSGMSLPDHTITVKRHRSYFPSDKPSILSPLDSLDEVSRSLLGESNSRHYNTISAQRIGSYRRYIARKPLPNFGVESFV